MKINLKQKILLIVLLISVIIMFCFFVPWYANAKDIIFLGHGSIWRPNLSASVTFNLPGYLIHPQIDTNILFTELIGIGIIGILGFILLTSKEEKK
jgi:hypothetical protein